ncbi:preQ(1) synthase [Candidatus Omnitrophota bacterium]
MQGTTFLLKDIDRSILQTFRYEFPKRPITVEHVTPEFTCICPFSGLPDFATLTIRYTPAKQCIELKSLKFYLFSFRQVRVFNEHVINKIIEDLVAVLKPRRMEITGEFTSRGGITNKVTASYGKP